MYVSKKDNPMNRNTLISCALAYAHKHLDDFIDEMWLDGLNRADVDRELAEFISYVKGASLEQQWPAEYVMLHEPAWIDVPGPEWHTCGVSIRISRDEDRVQIDVFPDVPEVGWTDSMFTGTFAFFREAEETAARIAYENGKNARKGGLDKCPYEKEFLMEAWKEGWSNGTIEG